MRWCASWVVWGAVMAALTLSGCADSASPRPARTPSPACKRRSAMPACGLGTLAQCQYKLPGSSSSTRCRRPKAAACLDGPGPGAGGHVYLARTAEGAIWAMSDADGDQFLDGRAPSPRG